MNRVMTFAADGNGYLHLLARKVFLEPAISMTTTRNQMMLGRTFFYRALAKLAGLYSVFSHDHQTPTKPFLRKEIPHQAPF